MYCHDFSRNRWRYAASTRPRTGTPASGASVCAICASSMFGSTSGSIPRARRVGVVLAACATQLATIHVVPLIANLRARSRCPWRLRTSSPCGSTSLSFLTALLDRLGDELAVLERGDVAELALGDQLDGLDAEPGRELAIERARRAAALDVAEHGRARPRTRVRCADELGEPLAAPPSFSCLRRIAGGHDRQRAALRLGALGDDDDRVADAAAVPAMERLDHARRGRSRSRGSARRARRRRAPRSARSSRRSGP